MLPKPIISLADYQLDNYLIQLWSYEYSYFDMIKTAHFSVKDFLLLAWTAPVHVVVPLKDCPLEPALE